MTSVERERGTGKGERDLWQGAVAAVIRGFEAVFSVEARASDEVSGRFAATLARA
jgi:hypothetical protein